MSRILTGSIGHLLRDGARFFRAFWDFLVERRRFTSRTSRSRANSALAGRQTYVMPRATRRPRLGVVARAFRGARFFAGFGTAGAVRAVRVRTFAARAVGAISVALRVVAFRAALRFGGVLRLGVRLGLALVVGSVVLVLVGAAGRPPSGLLPASTSPRPGARGVPAGSSSGVGRAGGRRNGRAGSSFTSACTTSVRPRPPLPLLPLRRRFPPLPTSNIGNFSAMTPPRLS
ncbi:hypothetical protein [Sorangium sp. So ce394]|uniref:hypothetical protein n=1 Tax=Sorangium sp. So ce394 TaxID=3133310 RepID=UPI003F5BC424